MLVLTRKQQETIRIGDHITITILKTKGKAVRVGIEAPSDVPVVRGELVASRAAVDSASTASDLTSGETIPLPRRGRRIASQPMESWPTKSRPNRADDASRRSALADVSHQRVSRENVAQVLPTLIGGGPLRELMSQRATV